jgi:hypothetical protein
MRLLMVYAASFFLATSFAHSQTAEADRCKPNVLGLPLPIECVDPELGSMMKNLGGLFAKHLATLAGNEKELFFLQATRIGRCWQQSSVLRGKINQLPTLSEQVNRA